MRVTLESTERLARAVHAGQVEKAEIPYIGHVERVVRYTQGLGGSEAQVMAAWLHDAVEDSPLTLEDLVAFGFPAEVVALVDALTHRKAEHEPRTAYYDRVLATPGALLVKQADLMDNTDPERVARLEPEVAARLAVKYQAARKHLGL